MPDKITCDVAYDEGRNMWCVTVYRNGVWEMEQWFYSWVTAEYWARRKELSA